MSTIVRRGRACARSTCHSSSHLGRRQHRRRLVEDEDLRAAVERLEDLDALRLADGEIGDEPLRAAPRVPSRALSSRTVSLGARAIELRARS